MYVVSNREDDRHAPMPRGLVLRERRSSEVRITPPTHAGG